VLASEARTWFARTKQSGCAALAPYFAELWDLPPSFSLATRKDPRHVHEPTLAFAGASTLEFLELAVDDTDFASGLINRLSIFVARPVELLPIPGRIDEQKINEVAAALLAARTCRVDFELSGKSKRDWGERFKALTARRRARHQGAETIAQSTSRVDTQAARYAVLSASILRRKTKRIEPDDVEFGWTIAEYCEASAITVFSQMALGRTVRLERKIEARLRRKGPQTRREISQTLGGGSSSYSARDINGVIDELTKADRLLYDGTRYSLPHEVGKVGDVGAGEES